MHKSLLALLCIIVVSNLSAFAGVQNASKTFPLPEAEVEEIISSALRHNDFEVARTDLGMGRTRLQAVKGKTTWEITLTPDSPLATRVRAVLRNEQGQAGLSEELDFWHIIDTPLSPGQPVEPSPETAQQEGAIPSVILSKIEAVVCLKAEKEGNSLQLSGFVVSEDGLILCTAHDLKNLQQVTVICHDGRTLPGNVIRTDHQLDLALVHVDRKFDTFINAADGRNLLGVGECLYSVGCPIDLGGTVYHGVINGPPRHVNGLPLWQVHMEIHHGSSGSPVFDLQGNLVAVVKGRYRGTDSIGFLIPLESIMDFAMHVDE